MDILKYPKRETWADLLVRPASDVTELFQTVRTILDEVRLHGDRAVRRFTEEYDRVAPGLLPSLEVTEEEMKEAERLVPIELKAALLLAQKNITTFHEQQRYKPYSVRTMDGVICQRRAVPVEKVGLYVPGGSAPLFSTVLMLATPARIAGCGEIILCTPPDKKGKVHPAILYAAALSGVHRVFKAGGVQAVAAMAYGTETIPKVYKIAGPGNRFVTAAKQMVSLRDVAIDMPAGPSEVAVLADGAANPRFVAADLLSQAEHGADSQVLLMTDAEELIQPVVDEVERQLSRLPRRDIAEKALAHSKIILLHSMEEAVEMSNEYAPEHLIIQAANYRELGGRVTNAGSVFLGALTPESAGDFVAGPSHVLPTGGAARMFSGLTAETFRRRSSFVEFTQADLAETRKAIETFGQLEGLDGHAYAATARFE